MQDTNRFSIKLFLRGKITKVPHKNISVIRDKGIKAINDICPHLGGPLSKGEYCQKSQTIKCPWHGYIFSLKSLDLLENPNEEVWAEKFGEVTHKEFKLKEFKCSQENNDIIIQE